MRCLQNCGSVFPQYKGVGEVAARSRRTDEKGDSVYVYTSLCEGVGCVCWQNMIS